MPDRAIRQQTLLGLRLFLSSLFVDPVEKYGHHDVLDLVLPELRKQVLLEPPSVVPGIAVDQGLGPVLHQLPSEGNNHLLLNTDLASGDTSLHLGQVLPRLVFRGLLREAHLPAPVGVLVLDVVLGLGACAAADDRPHLDLLGRS